MKFEKGTSGNPTGRPKKRMPAFNNANEIQKKIDKYLSENFEAVLDDLSTPAAREKARIYLDLLKYAVPRISPRQSEIQLGDLTNTQLKAVVNVLEHNAMPELEEQI